MSYLKLQPDALHHAYLICGDPEKACSDLTEFLSQECEVEVKGNPDLLHVKTARFGIDTARSVRQSQQKKAFRGRKFFILSFENITVEAQNSLLKSIEEPTAGTHFFLITPTKEQLLPTLLSRVEVIEYRKKEAKNNDQISSFLTSTVSKRLSIVEEIYKKDVSEARSFLDRLEESLYEEGVTHEATCAFDAIDLAKQYINHRGASSKLLLEHLALNCDVKK